MNCEVCPHMRRIREALAPCQHCEAGKLHGQISSDATDKADYVYAHAKPQTRNCSTGVTTLDPDTEDALRKFHAALFSLEDIELLLVKHMFGGGNYASFSRPLNDLIDNLNRKSYDLSKDSESFRQLSKTWADRIVRKLPQVGSVFKSVIDANKGKHNKR